MENLKFDREMEEQGAIKEGNRRSDRLKVREKRKCDGGQERERENDQEKDRKR